MISLYKMVIYILCVLFIILILYPLFLPQIEGLENQDYQDYNNSTDSAAILSQQNAGNISYLKEKLDELLSLKETVMDNCGNIISLNDRVNAIVGQQTSAVQQINTIQAPDLNKLQ